MSCTSGTFTNGQGCCCLVKGWLLAPLCLCRYYTSRNTDIATVQSSIIGGDIAWLSDYVQDFLQGITGARRGVPETRSGGTKPHVT